MGRLSEWFCSHVINMAQNNNMIIILCPCFSPVTGRGLDVSLLLSGDRNANGGFDSSPAMLMNYFIRSRKPEDETEVTKKKNHFYKTLYKIVAKHSGLPRQFQFKNLRQWQFLQKATLIADVWRINLAISSSEMKSSFPNDPNSQNFSNESIN